MPVSLFAVAGTYNIVSTRSAYSDQVVSVLWVLSLAINLYAHFGSVRLAGAYVPPCLPCLPAQRHNFFLSIVGVSCHLCPDWDVKACSEASRQQRNDRVIKLAERAVC